MKSFNIEFETTPISNIENKQQRVVNLAVQDLPKIIRQSLNLAIEPCKCGKATKILIKGSATGPKTSVNWCCSDFQSKAERYIPFNK